jgi:RNase P subunit RPR2
MKTIKEYRTTCQSCGTIKHFPYVDFDELIKNEKNQNIGQKTKKGLLDGFIIGSTTMACPVFGCCMAVDKTHQGILKNQDKEYRLKYYCKAFLCKNCKSQALKIDIIEHEVE